MLYRRSNMDLFRVCFSICSIYHSFEESDDGTYTMKKVLIQNTEQLELVREEIHVSSLFSHPNLLPLLDHAIISVKNCYVTVALVTKPQEVETFHLNTRKCGKYIGGYYCWGCNVAYLEVQFI